MVETPSKFISLIGEFTSNIKKEKDVVYCNNKNIFSFNDKNIELWRQKYQEGRNQSNKKDLKTKISKDTIMRFIINERKKQIHSKLSPIFNTEKYANHLPDIIQNMIKSEFLGFIDFPYQGFNYKFFTYYIGENNLQESIKKPENWKLLNTNVLILFHSNINEWEKHLKLEIVPMSESIYTKTQETKYLLGLDDLFNDFFKKPEIINSDIKDLIIDIDPRFIYKKYAELYLNKKSDTSKPKQLKRKREEKSGGDNNNNKKRKLTINEDDLSKKDDNCLKNALSISTSLDLISPEDYQKRMNIVPENIEFTTNDFINILNNFINPHEDKIEYNPSKIAEIIISVLNPLGIINNTIRKISQRDADTIRNSDYDEIIKNILENPEKQEYLRNEIYSHINALFTIALLTRNI